MQEVENLSIHSLNSKKGHSRADSQTHFKIDMVDHLDDAKNNTDAQRDQKLSVELQAL